jgi:hypothetical protein
MRRRKNLKRKTSPPQTLADALQEARDREAHRRDPAREILLMLIWRARFRDPGRPRDTLPESVEKCFEELQKTRKRHLRKYRVDPGLIIRDLYFQAADEGMAESIYEGTIESVKRAKEHVKALRAHIDRLAPEIDQYRKEEEVIEAFLRAKPYKADIPREYSVLADMLAHYEQTMGVIDRLETEVKRLKESGVEQLGWEDARPKRRKAFRSMGKGHPSPRWYRQFVFDVASLYQAGIKRRFGKETTTAHLEIQWDAVLEVFGLLRKLFGAFPGRSLTTDNLKKARKEHDKEGGRISPEAARLLPRH